MIAFRSFIFFLCALFFLSKESKRYVIVAGDITCKACVIQLHDYLSKKVKKDRLTIGLRDKGNIIMNESGPDYYKKELPKASYIFLTQQSFFPPKERYPYLFIITKNDTLKIPYDSLFIAEGLNTSHLR